MNQVNSDVSPQPQVVVDVGWLVHTVDQTKTERMRYPNPASNSARHRWGAAESDDAPWLPTVPGVGGTVVGAGRGRTLHL